MANMIIKPAVGGNLLIQDRAGGAVLSTGTSGATIADGIALGDNASSLSGVLPAGVTGGSGLTALGTVASSGTINGQTLSDSGWVFLNSYLHNSWADYNSGYATRYRAIGNIAMITGIVRYGSGSIMVVPSAIRPAHELYFPFPGLSDSFGASANDMYLSLAVNGTLNSVVVGTAWTSIGITYIIG